MGTNLTRRVLSECELAESPPLYYDNDDNDAL
jgi:hypothetical protein